MPEIVTRDTGHWSQPSRTPTAAQVAGVQGGGARRVHRGGPALHLRAQRGSGAREAGTCPRSHSQRVGNTALPCSHLGKSVRSPPLPTALQGSRLPGGQSPSPPVAREALHNLPRPSPALPSSLSPACCIYPSSWDLASPQNKIKGPSAEYTGALHTCEI